MCCSTRPPKLIPVLRVQNHISVVCPVAGRVFRIIELCYSTVYVLLGHPESMSTLTLGLQRLLTWPRAHVLQMLSLTKYSPAAQCPTGIFGITEHQIWAVGNVQQQPIYVSPVPPASSWQGPLP